MFACVNIVAFHLLLLLHFLSTAVGHAAPANASDFPGHHSGSRLAYFRWRAWLLSHPAVVQKVPPMPRTAEASGAGGLDVHLLITPSRIFKVDEVQQTVHVAAVFEFWWVDPALAVDSDLVQVFTDGNSSLLPYSVTVPSKVLWVPALITVEGVSSLEILQDVNEAQVQPNGNVSINLPYVFSFTCRFDMTGYPFDDHHCSITVLDTSHSVSVHPSGRPWDKRLIQNFGVVGEWTLVDVTEKSVVYSLSGGKTYSQFILHLRRKPTFYVVILICPLVLTSYLNTLVFLLPPDLGDKASYLVTLAISMSVFTSFFNADMPRGFDSMPRIFLLHIFVLAESLVTLVMSLVVLRRYKMELRQQETEGSATPGAWGTREGCVFPGREEEESKVKKTNTGHLSAKSLDMIFFLVALTGNTIGIAVILAALV